ncbi:MAG: 50S ribosomal protein L11 methyltransferase [Leptospiraceae bacterium]|nr:50S ribosomal protein L11 methyltransferase [Leptospiraceae bacterium]MDW8306379.1 50S ribosomal protein L11 methyltransferase [Leptospiraceae bacterium]
MEIKELTCKFQQVEITLPKDIKDHVEEFLLKAGGLASYEVLYRDGISNLYSEKTTLVVFFPANYPARAVVELSLALLGVEFAQTEYSLLEPKDYLREFEKSFKAFPLTHNIWLVPPWDRDNPAIEPQALKLFLNPGLAFGTGRHPTTKLMIAWLEKVVRCEDSLLDLGCGSGILALVAALLGAKRVQGVDVDPLAVASARENALLNAASLSGKTVEFYVDDFRFMESRHFKGFPHIFVANLLPNIFYQNEKFLLKYIAHSRSWALGGIVSEQEGDFALFLRKNNIAFTLSELEGWLLFSSL